MVTMARRKATPAVVRIPLYPVPLSPAVNDNRDAVREAIAECLDDAPPENATLGAMLGMVRARIDALESERDELKQRADDRDNAALDFERPARQFWYTFAVCEGRDPRAWADLSWETRDGVKRAVEMALDVARSEIDG